MKVRILRDLAFSIGIALGMYAAITLVLAVLVEIGYLIQKAGCC